MDSVFPAAAPFDSEEYKSFGRHLLSNLMGGLGFFHGDSKVDLSHAAAYEETSLEFWKEAADAMALENVTVTQPILLLSHSPSRAFFPRGFLWDEGFHLLPLLEWDLDHALTVLKSWLHRMDTDGWIPREQVRSHPWILTSATADPGLTW
jgi:mannosyl-oligosaccharide glucosidase